MVSAISVSVSRPCPVSLPELGPPTSGALVGARFFSFFHESFRCLGHGSNFLGSVLFWVVRVTKDRKLGIKLMWVCECRGVAVCAGVCVYILKTKLCF